MGEIEKKMFINVEEKHQYLFSHVLTNFSAQ